MPASDCFCVGKLLASCKKSSMRYTCANDLSTRDWQKLPEIAGSLNLTDDGIYPLVLSMEAL